MLSSLKSFIVAKELPYFKFEPQAWDTGNIQMCSRESKGLFIDLCSLYWSRLGEVPHALALQKLCSGNKSALQELAEHEIIGVVEGQIVIEFLDEQLSEFADTSEKRRNAANKRWKDASALQLESKSNAIREEEIRLEEKRKDESDAGKPATIEQRASEFMDKVAKHLNGYSKEMLRDFYDYWTEKNDGGRKMRFEMQKVFDINRRLKTWYNNEKKERNGHPKKQSNIDSLKNHIAERIMRESGQ